MNASSKTFLEMLSALPTPVAIVDLESGRMVWVNGAHTVITGAESPERVIGRNIFEFLGPEQMATAMADLEAMARGETPPPVVYHVRRLDGATADVQIASIPATFERRPAMVSVITDVTETERAKRDLARSEARFRSMVETAPLGIVFVHEDTVNYANLAAARVLRRPQDAIIGAQASTLVDVPSRKALRAARDRIHAGLDTSVEVDVVFLPEGAEPLPVVCTVSFAEWDGEPGYRISMRRRSDVE